jgi:hypothetical protein
MMAHNDTFDTEYPASVDYADIQKAETIEDLEAMIPILILAIKRIEVDMAVVGDEDDEWSRRAQGALSHKEAQLFLVERKIEKKEKDSTVYKVLLADKKRAEKDNLVLRQENNKLRSELKQIKQLISGDYNSIT